MIRWLLYLLPATVITMFCYITNPFIALAADEEGELPGLLHLWQTWDDSCDSEFYMTECVPTWLDYGYAEHYFSMRDTDQRLKKYGRTRTFSVVHPGATWTVKQKLQRYICRVLWLTRNCGYGFMFYWFGADMSGAAYKLYEKDKFYCTNGKYFSYKNEQNICSWLKWKIYLGWKTYPDNQETGRCMLAYRLILKVVRDE